MIEQNEKPMPEPIEADAALTGEDQAPPEMTPRLLARLFVVPLLIVVMIVGCSLAVFLLFGWISESREQSVEKLVARIEAGAGDKVLDVAMLPRDREVWQAAVDLARKIQATDGQQLSPEERASVAARLDAVLKKSAKTRQSDMGREMQQYLLTTLGRLGQADSVPVLVGYATDSAQPVGVRRDAVAALILMKDVPAARRAWPEVALLLDAPEPVLRIVSVAAVGALAEPGDPAAVQALRQAYAGPDREVQWNAALALARLGDASATPLLNDMLTRAYWEAIPVELEAGDHPDEPRRLTEVQVESYLVVAMDAARRLGTPALRERIEALKQDPSPAVRDQAAKALAAWPTPATLPGEVNRGYEKNRVRMERRANVTARRNDERMTGWNNREGAA